MVVKCSIFGCTNRKDKQNDLQFYRLPAVIKNQGDECEKLSNDRRRGWLAKIGQKFDNKNLQNVRVCSAHFISGRRADLYDTTNPDWIPSLLLGNPSTKKRDPSPDAIRYKRLQTRKRKLSEDQAIAPEFAFTSDHDYSSSDVADGVSVQTDLTGNLQDSMISELQVLRSENFKLKKELELNSTKYGEEFFRESDERVKHLTGLPIFFILVTLFKFIEQVMPESVSVDKFRMLVLTLMRLRLNLSNLVLAYQFNITQSTVSRIFHRVINVLYHRMKETLIRWPEREDLQKTMPMEFRKNFGKKCAVIIDCFEVFIEKPTGLNARAETWSSYKHHHTIKFLIGITPQGTISYISEAWGGRVSDKYITENSSFLTKLLPGDLVLADRGFDVSDSVGSVCAEVKIPAFTKGRDQLSPLDVETTRKLAHSRIHVERVIGSIRQKYTFLNGTIPINLLMSKDDHGVSITDKIVTVCCGLVNLCDTIIDFD